MQNNVILKYEMQNNVILMFWFDMASLHMLINILFILVIHTIFPSKLFVIYFAKFSSLN